MAEFSGPTSPGTSDRATMERVGMAWGPDGVVSGLVPSALTTSVRVGAGWGVVAGVGYENTGNTDKAISLNSSGNPRIDRVVLRRTWSTGVAALAYVTGVPGATPSPPALTNTRAGGTYDIPICRFTVANGTAAPTSLVDERLWQTPQVQHKVTYGFFHDVPDSFGVCRITHGLNNSNARIVVTPFDTGSPADRIVRFVNVGQDNNDAVFLCQRIDSPDLGNKIFLLAGSHAEWINSNPSLNPIGQEAITAMISRIAAVDVAGDPVAFNSNIVGFHWIAVAAVA